MHNKFIKTCININTINFLKIKLKSYEFIKIKENNKLLL